MNKTWGDTSLIVLVAFIRNSMGLRPTREALANRALHRSHARRPLRPCPPRVWVRVADTANTAFTDAHCAENDDVEKLFVRLDRDSTQARAPVQLVPTTDDGAAVELFRTMPGVRSEPKALERFVAANRDRMSLRRAATGMVGTAKDEDHRLLEGKIERLAAGFVVPEDGAALSFGPGLAWPVAGVGAVVGAWCVFVTGA